MPHAWIVCETGFCCVNCELLAGTNQERQRFSQEMRCFSAEFAGGRQRVGELYATRNGLLCGVAGT